MCRNGLVVKMHKIVIKYSLQVIHCTTRKNHDIIHDIIHDSIWTVFPDCIEELHEQIHEHIHNVFRRYSRTNERHHTQALNQHHLPLENPKVTEDIQLGLGTTDAVFGALAKFV